MPNSSGLEYWLIVLIAVMLLGTWLIRKAGHGLRGELTRKVGAQGPTLSKEQLEAIRIHRLATPEELFKMSPKEQQLLATTALMMSTAQTQRRTREQ